jgi:hypothetical protein
MTKAEWDKKMRERDQKMRKFQRDLERDPVGTMRRNREEREAKAEAERIDRIYSGDGARRVRTGFFGAVLDFFSGE